VDSNTLAQPRHESSEPERDEAMLLEHLELAQTMLRHATAAHLRLREYSAAGDAAYWELSREVGLNPTLCRVICGEALDMLEEEEAHGG
jgi:hypothetical protein